MRDLKKSSEVKFHLQLIKDGVESYDADAHPIYFDYDGVIDLLKQAGMLLVESARCPRPANLPPGIPWCERLAGGDDVFDRYAFDGTMSIEDTIGCMN